MAESATWRLSARVAAGARVLMRLPPADRAAIEPLFADGVREELHRGYLRLAALDAAAWHSAGAVDPWPLAGQLLKALNAAASSSWINGKTPPTDGARASLWRLLRLTRGRVLSRRQLSRYLEPMTSEAVAMSLTLPDTVPDDQAQEALTLRR